MYSQSVESLMGIVLEIANGGSVALSPVHRQKILNATRKNERIQFVLPAFPAKSPNRNKTLSDAPDFAELLSLRRLNAICARIGQIYGPGAEIIICSDGRVFSDLVQVSDEKITSYALEIENMIERHTLTHLKTYHLDHAFSDQVNPTNHHEMREALLSRYAQCPTLLREKIKVDAAALRLFNGMHRFIFEDRVVLEASTPGKSRERTRTESKEIAYELIRRSDAWSKLIEEFFPEAVRLSIHPQSDHSPKLGVQLAPSSDPWRTPWHSVALLKDGQFSLVRRKDAEEAGAILTYFEERYAYYELA
jgi:pyoverdine/dityrosine biosynthesis protein Dit1